MSDDYLTLLDWRLRVSDLYAEVRARLCRDPLDAHKFWREGRDELFRSHPQSPLPAAERGGFPGVPYYEYNARFAFRAPIRSLPAQRYDVVTSSGSTIPFVRFGAVDLPIGTLEVMWLDAYGGGLFLPFRDATSGRTTYGGGRYVIDAAKHADLGERDGVLTLDLNFAYHPSCAYDPRWSCPFAPRQNWLSVAVEAGERR